MTLYLEPLSEYLIIQMWVQLFPFAWFLFFGYASKSAFQKAQETQGESKLKYVYYRFCFSIDILATAYTPIMLYNLWIG